jgi:glycolate oxidase FAD binding subunit
MEEAGLESHLAAEDDDRWDRQRGRQRSAAGAVVRVSGLASELPKVLRSAQELGASMVGRAGLGLSWMTLGQADVPALVSNIEEVRRQLHPFPCVVLDAPLGVREKVDVWGDDGPATLMRRVKARFDGPGVCNRGIFVGGI